SLRQTSPAVRVDNRLLFARFQSHSARTSGNSWAPSRWRQRSCTISSSLNAISSPLVLEPAPLVARSRKRTVANGDSITLVVRRCFQCSAGKSKKVIRRSHLAVSDSTAFGYLG